MELPLCAYLIQERNSRISFNCPRCTRWLCNKSEYIGFSLKTRGDYNFDSRRKELLADSWNLVRKNALSERNLHQLVL